MYQHFAYNRDDFLTQHHRRSKVETVFAMVKSKFADGLLSKTTEAQTNEVLCKFVAHNLGVLIQAFHVLGIESPLGPSRTLIPWSGSSRNLPSGSTRS